MIETTCSPEQLQEMQIRIQRSWEDYGAGEPYANVLTSDLYKMACFEANAEGFWKSGYHDVNQFVEQAHRSGVVLDFNSTVLDYGCGVGRTLIPLAQRFQAMVYGCDISQPYLDVARRELDKRGLEGISLMRGFNPQYYSVLFSILVLQHNPPPVIAHTLNRLLRSLLPGGLAYFQLPTFRSGYEFSVEAYLANLISGRFMETHGIPQCEVFRIAARNDCHPLEVREVNASELGASTFYLFQKVFR